MDQPGPAIYPDMRLHPEIPLLALAGLVHLGVARFVAFLVELGALMMVASTIVPVPTFRPFAAKMLVDGGKYLCSKLVLLQQVAELANRGLVRHRLTAEIDAGKLPHRSRVIQRLLHRRDPRD